MGWSAAVHEVWVDSLVGRPRGSGGRFRLPWSGGVGCSWGSAFFVVVVYMYVTLHSGACVPMFVHWCVCERRKKDIILIQSKIFEFKNLTAICFHAARWI